MLLAANKGAASTLVFDNLQAAPDCGLALQHSRVVVTLVQQQFPTVAFDLNLTSFSSREWQQAIGLQPFHFLTLGLPEATVWHQRGWLFATPRADLFPLLLDVHAGMPELSASYNHEWSATPPLSAHALPVVGLWSPARKLYIGWDFQASRIGDNSERDIATGFCNRLIVPVEPRIRQPIEETQPPASPLPDADAPRSRNGKPPSHRDPRTRRPLSYDQQASRELDHSGVGKFVALVYPQGGADARQPAYPKAGTRLSSRATLTFNTDLSDTDDPNRFLWQNWWNTPSIYSHLANVPLVNDLSWLPTSTLLQTLTPAPQNSLLTVADDQYHIPGSLLLAGQNTLNESQVETAFHTDSQTQLTQLQADAQTLLHYAKHFTLDKEPCVYWEQPLAGEWTTQWGGEPATTLHSHSGWAAARLLLDLYKEEKRRREEEKKRRKAEQNEHTSASLLTQEGEKHPNSSLLPTIDGVFNWTKRVVWTRGRLGDSPASASVEDGASAIAFLLDYYFTFKDDLTEDAHHTRALQALELARTFAYRYLIMWTGNGDSGGAENSAFLWERRSGQEPAGGAQDGENLDALAQVAVHTGDPILMWALRGSLSRGTALFQNMPQQAVVKEAADQERTPGTTLTSTAASMSLHMMEPVGDTQMRVLCGERAALAFDRNAQTLNVRDYRCTSSGDFAFTLRAGDTSLVSPANTRRFSVTITFPYVDLSRKTVAVRHGNVTQKTLDPGAELMREPDAFWSLIVRNLRDGDTVIVGKPDLSAANRLPVAPPRATINGLLP